MLFQSQRVTVPKSLHAEMLKRIHASHVGGNACYRQARDTLYWPSMHREVKDYVSQCSERNEYSHEQQRDTMLSHALPMQPWQIVNMDLFRQAGKKFLLIVDVMSLSVTAHPFPWGRGMLLLEPIPALSQGEGRVLPGQVASSSQGPY